MILFKEIKLMILTTLDLPDRYQYMSIPEIMDVAKTGENKIHFRIPYQCILACKVVLLHHKGEIYVLKSFDTQHVGRLIMQNGFDVGNEVLGERLRPYEGDDCGEDGINRG